MKKKLPTNFEFSGPNFCYSRVVKMPYEPFFAASQSINYNITIPLVNCILRQRTPRLAVNNYGEFAFKGIIAKETFKVMLVRS